MMRKTMKNLSFVLLLTMLITVLAGCDDTPNPRATITLEDGREMVVILYPEKAPNTVANFISLANSGFYDGLTFHRVVSDFIIQGGDPNGDGTGGPDYSINGEFSNNGFNKNDLSHLRGVISMARFGSASAEDAKDYYNTAGSQFFIMVDDKTSLDGDYAAFGKVFTGLDVLDDISTVKVDSDNKPKEPITIKTIRVDTYGKDYGDPKTNPVDETLIK